MQGEGGRREKENNHSLPRLPWHLDVCSLLLYAPSAILISDWNHTLYNNSGCTKRSISTNTVTFLTVYPESTASFLRWKWTELHTAFRYSMDCYTHTPPIQRTAQWWLLWSLVLPRLLNSFIFGLKECWAENYHNLNNWTLIISSWPTTLYIYTLLCIYISELCLVFLSHSYLTSQSQPSSMLLRKTEYCQQSLWPRSSHPFAL